MDLRRNWGGAYSFRRAKGEEENWKVGKSCPVREVKYRGGCRAGVDKRRTKLGLGGLWPV